MVIIHEDSFGVAVSKRIVAESPSSWRVLALSQDSVESALEDSPFSVVIAGFLGSSALKKMDDIVAKAQTWWVPVRLQERFLFIGPVIGPGTACLACFDKRTLVNPPDSRTSATERVVRRYRSRPNSSSAVAGGYTPAMASMAASVIVEIAPDPAASGSRFWQIDGLYPMVGTGEATCIHGCPRRRGPGEPKNARFTRSVAEVIRE